MGTSRNGRLYGLKKAPLQDFILTLCFYRPQKTKFIGEKHRTYACLTPSHHLRLKCNKIRVYFELSLLFSHGQNTTILLSKTWQRVA